MQRNKEMVNSPTSEGGRKEEIQGSPGDIENAPTIQVKNEDKDIAIAVVGEHRHAIDPEMEARVVRKIDLFLVPAMTIGYGLVYYDKVSRILSIVKMRQLLIDVTRQSWDPQSSLE